MINSKALKTSFVSIIIGLIIFLLLYHINCFLVNILISPLSPLVIIYIMYSIIAVQLIGCAELPRILYTLLLAGSFSFILITHYIMSYILKCFFYSSDPAFIYAMVSVLIGAGLIFVFIPLIFKKFATVFLKHDDFNKLMAKYLYFGLLLFEILVFSLGKNFSGGKMFYPKYVASKTKTAIRTNYPKICKRLSTLFYTIDYHNQSYLNLRYDYPFVASNTCLTATKAINNTDPKKCFFNNDDDYIQFEMGREYSQIIQYKHPGMSKFHRLLIARNCQILYKSHFPDSGVKVIKINPSDIGN